MTTLKFLRSHPRAAVPREFLERAAAVGLVRGEPFLQAPSEDTDRQRDASGGDHRSAGLGSAVRSAAVESDPQDIVVLVKSDSVGEQVSWFRGKVVDFISGALFALIFLDRILVRMLRARMVRHGVNSVGGLDTPNEAPCRGELQGSPRQSSCEFTGRRPS